MNNKNSKQILEEIIKRVVKETIQEELKPLKKIFYTVLKEQVNNQKQVVEINKQQPSMLSGTISNNNGSISSFNIPNDEPKSILQNLLEQTTPFSSSEIEGTAGPMVPPHVEEGTDFFAKKDYRNLMQKIDEKANNTFRP
jgi:hypothetical protein